MAVQDVSRFVSDGEIVSLFSPFGCGKSIRLNRASSLNGASGVKVHVGAVEIIEVNEHVSFMLRRDLLLA